MLGAYNLIVSGFVFLREIFKIKREVTIRLNGYLFCFYLSKKLNFDAFGSQQFIKH